MSEHDRPSLRPETDEDLEAEIRHHIREKTELLVASGWDPEEARREAERRFGDVRRIRREMRRADRQRGGGGEPSAFAHALGSDLRYALRGFRRQPGFTASVVATLALGIGAASAIFAVVDALLVRPLPYREVERLVDVSRNGLSPERAVVWREAADAMFDGWVEWNRATIVRTDGELAEPLSVVGVTPGADTLLGLPLLLGRGFTAEDALPGAPEVAILGRRYFDRLGGEPSVLGRTIRLESGPATVVGVLRDPIKFPNFADLPDLWLPMRTDHTVAGDSLSRIQGVWARLLPNLTIEAAQARVDQVAARLDEAQPLERGSWELGLYPVDGFRQNPDVRRALRVIAGTVALLFLIAVVNGVNLVLVRTLARESELGVREALGGSRFRILRQLLMEGVALGAIGGGAALGVAWLAAKTIGSILPAEVLFFAPHAVDVESRTLVFAFAVSLFVGVALGLLPAARLLHRGPAHRLTLRRTDDGARGRRARNGLVVAQVALSMTLLAGAGLFVKSFSTLLAVDPGYDHGRIAMAVFGPSSYRYPTATDRAQLVHRLEAALEAHPAVTGVTTASGGGLSFGSLEAEGLEPPEERPRYVPNTDVALDYFEVMGLDIVEGRGFVPGDHESDAVVIDLDLARFLWGDASPLGRRFRIEDRDWLTVVGVVRELRLTGRDQREGPYQLLYPAPSDEAGSYIELLVRTEGDPAALLPVIRETFRAVDPAQAVFRLRTAAADLAEEEEKPRFLMTLMSLLAAVAVTLASVGLYGVLAYSVRRRDRELGVRIALGAARGEVRSMVLREGLVVAAIGIGAGLVGALFASRTIEQLLYEVEPGDPSTLAATALLFLAIAAAASFLPARRATQVDPVEVLKAE